MIHTIAVYRINGTRDVIVAQSILDKIHHMTDGL